MSAPEKCVTQLIQHSPCHQELFNKLIRDMDAQHNVAPASSARIKDLKSAMHRFESHFEPISRMVLFWPAYVMCAITIAVERKTEFAGRSAAKFLLWVDEMRLLALAMMADAAQQGLYLVRYWDDPDLDPATIPTELNAFVCKIKMLFLKGHCVKMGHTHHMIKFLSTPILVPKQATGGRLKTIGGTELAMPVFSAILQKCNVGSP